MIGNRTCIIALSAASAMLSLAPPAGAADFDGSWSMVAETTRGHCGTIEIDLGVDRGRISGGCGSSGGHCGRGGGRNKVMLRQPTRSAARCALHLPEPGYHK